MFRHAPIVRIVALALFVSLFGCESTPVNAPAPSVAETNFEGLATVRSRAFDTAQIRPGTDFRAYSRVKLGKPELAYRATDRSGGDFPLTEEQKNRFHESLVSAFDNEFANLRGVEIVDVAGPATLTLEIRVEDIVVSVAPSAVGRAGRAAALLEASGEAIIVIELRDSQSNAILARGVDAASAKGGALRTPDKELKTRFESADKLVTTWAAKARNGLENLLSEGR